MMHLERHPIILILITLTALSAHGGETWTRFRGPNGAGQGVEADFPDRWTDADYNWRVELPGIGHSSPIVWGDRIVVQSADLKTANHHVICLRAADGGKLWQRSFPFHGYRIHTRNSYASSSPAVDGQMAFVAWSTPETTKLIALNVAGDTVWERDLGPFVSQHGFGTSPMVHHGLVYLASLQNNGEEMDSPNSDAMPETSFIAAFDSRTGETRWKTVRRSSGSSSYSVPCVVRGSDGQDQLICCSTADGMFSLDPETGAENWSIGVFAKRTVSSPVAAGGLVFGSTGSGGGGNYVVAVRPQNPPEEVYRVTTLAPYVPCSVASGDLLFLWSDKGVVTCAEIDDGKTVWQKRVGGNFSSSPICVGDRVLCASDDGEVIVLAASRDYQLLGRSSLGGPTRATPAVGHGRVYFRTYSHLMSLRGG